GRTINDQMFDSYMIYRKESQRNKSQQKTPIRTSQRAYHRLSTAVTTLAVMLSLCGFIVQFVGLRGLNWTVTVAQLGVTLTMTAFRVVIRRHMASSIPSEKVQSNHELDEVAKRILH